MFTRLCVNRSDRLTELLTIQLPRDYRLGNQICWHPIGTRCKLLLDFLNLSTAKLP